MRQRWSPGDLLDLEFLLGRDQEMIDQSQGKDVAGRDRAIYLQIKDMCTESAMPEDSGCLLRLWLSRRRLAFVDNNQGSVLPGKLFQEVLRIAGWGLFLVALVTGWGLARSFLSYSGTTPINVSTYLGLFVGTQLLLLFSLLVSWLISRLAKRDSFPVTYALLRRILFQLTTKLLRIATTEGSTDLWLAGLTGRLRRQKKMYGVLLALPFFSRIQLAGVGFNIGVLTATLLTVIGKDIAFGWQSSLQLGAETVYHLVRVVGFPWSWIFPEGVAYPDPAQIKGSQIVLKDGLYHLVTGDLVSWWPFLCLCVAVYGLLPRVVLWLAGWFTARSLLGRLVFNTALQQQLLHRMRTPRLQVDPENRVESPTLPINNPPAPPGKTTSPVASGQVVALIPDEIFDECPDEEFAPLVQECLGLQLKNCLRVSGESGADRALLGQLTAEDSTEGPSFLLLQEAWQPPITEFLTFVRDLRGAVGEKTLISIVLIGKPSPDTIFTEVRQQDYAIWRQKVDALADPYLQCLRLSVS